MEPSALIYIAIFSALVAVAAAVAAVTVTRRGADAGLRGDVNELSQFVERLARDTRRERMRRVRAGEKVADEPVLAPPELQIPAEVAPTGDRKTVLRARLRQIKGGL